MARDAVPATTTRSAIAPIDRINLRFDFRLLFVRIGFSLRRSPCPVLPPAKRTIPTLHPCHYPWNPSFRGPQRHRGIVGETMERVGGRRAENGRLARDLGEVGMNPKDGLGIKSRTACGVVPTTDTRREHSAPAEEEVCVQQWCKCGGAATVIDVARTRAARWANLKATAHRKLSMSFERDPAEAASA